MTPDERIGAAGAGVTFLAFVSLAIRSMFRQNTQLHAQLEAERASCGERLSKLETRLDAEREQCDRQIAHLRDELRLLNRRVSSITPPPFPAVQEPQ